MAADGTHPTGMLSCLISVYNVNFLAGAVSVYDYSFPVSETSSLWASLSLSSLKKLSLSIAVLTQCIKTATLKKRGLRSIATKVMLQMQVRIVLF